MNKSPRPDSRKIRLYDILLNVYEVDEAAEVDAQIDGKLIRLTSVFQGPNFNNDAFYFDFFRDDTFEKHSCEKVNTRFRIYEEHEYAKDKKTGSTDYYAYLPYYYYLFLAWKFNKTWIQQKDNLMWLTSATLTLFSVIIAYYAIRLTQKEDKPAKLDSTQIQQITNALNKNKPVSIDTAQFNDVKRQLTELRKPLKKKSTKNFY